MLIEDTVEKSFSTKSLGQVQTGERERNTKNDQIGQDHDWNYINLSVKRAILQDILLPNLRRTIPNLGIQVVIKGFWMLKSNLISGFKYQIIMLLL